MKNYHTKRSKQNLRKSENQDLMTNSSLLSCTKCEHAHYIYRGSTSLICSKYIRILSESIVHFKVRSIFF